MSKKEVKVKSLYEYTRSELTSIRDVAVNRTREITTYMYENNDPPASVLDALQNELDSLQGTIAKIGNQLKTLHARCIFCRERQEVEVSTITFICDACDKRVFGRP